MAAFQPIALVEVPFISYDIKLWSGGRIGLEYCTHFFFAKVTHP